MRVHNLSVHNIRGLRRIEVQFDGESRVILGDNGTGKSALLDSLDFLLTGDMDRLSGRRGLGVRSHGKHVQALAEECYVEALVKVPHLPLPIRLRRRFSAPGIIECPDAELSSIQPFLEVAHHRRHLLTRSNLLKFISAAPSDRASAIQAILNLDRVERTRQVLVSASNSEASRAQQARASTLSAKGALLSTLGLPTFDEARILASVNSMRSRLGAEPIATLRGVRQGVVRPNSQDRPIAPSDGVLGQILSVGRALTPEVQGQLNGWDGELQTVLKSLAADPGALRAARHLELVELGMSHIDEEGSCPLCDTDWDLGALRAHLQDKVAKGAPVAPAWNSLRKATDWILTWLAIHDESLDRLASRSAEAFQTVSDADKALSEVARSLKSLREALTDPMSRFMGFRTANTTLSEQLRLEPARLILQAMYKVAKAASAPDPAEAAWDTLTRVEENLGALESSQRLEAKASDTAGRLFALRQVFTSARNRVLDEVYESVRARFVSLYKRLHAPHEQNFDASLTPGDAGLELGVDFHGMGLVPPFALHSEGHQDSMGLCLFFALSEQSPEPRLQHFLLDDVVMSVDVGHRHAVALLLAELCRDRQFIITTHDRVWARQLQIAGCVQSSGVVRLLSWSLEGGVTMVRHSDFVEEARQQLGDGNVRGAAATLRNGLEEFFQVVADALGAPVPYSISGTPDYGQLYGASCGAQREILKKAKAAARSWAQTDKEQAFEGRMTERGPILQHASVEGWAVNPIVHFNAWLTMTPEEFVRVVDAFAAVRDLFRCRSCGGIISLISEGATPQLAKCGCGSISWNLVPR